MTGPQAAPRRSLGWLDLARVLFVVAAIGFGWWGLRSSGSQIVAALAQTSPPRAVVACALVLVGLSITGALWRRILSGYGHRVPGRQASAVFFVGQLGKYIPGSVWSLGAQADMARRFGVPARTTVAVGLVFLWIHVTTAVPVAAVLGDASGWGVLGTPAVRAVVCALALAAVTPPALSRIGDLLAKAPEPLRLGWRDTGWFLVLMGAVWALYGAATVLMVPPAVLMGAGGSSAVLGDYVGAFALSYVVGVLVILAPAGVGAREITLVALLAPAIGLPAAAATALLIRAVHTVCDFGIAALTWALARSDGAAARHDPAGRR